MRFWLHYNKPASLAAGENRLTIHFRKACHIVSDIDCRVPVHTRARKTQPRCVLVGDAKKITLIAGKAYIK